MPTFTEQLRRHSVALISLTVAIVSLAYNTWRNEQSETNRNIRTVGVEAYLKVGELERSLLFSAYGNDNMSDYLKNGWAAALAARDLGMLLPEPARSATLNLFEAWNTGSLELAEASSQRERDSVAGPINASIDSTKAAVLEVVARLD